MTADRTGPYTSSTFPSPLTSVVCPPVPPARQTIPSRGTDVPRTAVTPTPRRDTRFHPGGGCPGHYRALKLWEAAGNEAGSLDQAAVIRALDHAKLAAGPGGPAEMVPGEHHVRMNMYIAQAQNGKFKIVKDLGHVDPKESIGGAGQAPELLAAGSNR